jgi:membrane protein DedA with SNARE-associated domain
VAFAEHALFVGTFVPGEVILPLTARAAAQAPADPGDRPAGR